MGVGPPRVDILLLFVYKTDETFTESPQSVYSEILCPHFNVQNGEPVGVGVTCQCAYL